MKSYTLKRNSWHHWLADKGGLWKKDPDICNYIRCVIVGFFKVVFVSLITLGMILLFAYGFWEIFALAFYSKSLGFAGTVVLGVVIAFSFLFIAGFTSIVISNAVEKRSEKEPGFISLAYRKFKDKTCVRVRIE